MPGARGVIPVHCRLSPMRTSTNGVLQVLAGVLASLQSAQSGLREAAVQTLLARKAARQQAQQKKDDARREAGRADLSKLTVPLLRQERLARGETVEVRIPKRRDELLRAVEAARAAEPAIPTPLDAPPPPPAAAPAAAQAPVAQALVLDASLVGRRALALWAGATPTTHLRASLGIPPRSSSTGRAAGSSTSTSSMAQMCSLMMRTSSPSRCLMIASSGAPATHKCTAIDEAGRALPLP